MEFYYNIKMIYRLEWLVRLYRISSDMALHLLAILSDIFSSVNSLWRFRSSAIFNNCSLFRTLNWFRRNTKSLNFFLKGCHMHFMQSVQGIGSNYNSVAQTMRQKILHLCTTHLSITFIETVLQLFLNSPPLS